MKKNKKLFALLFCCLFLFSTIFGATLKYDRNGDVYFDYGTRKYTNEEIVDEDTFDQITIFSAIEFGDWNVIQKELDSGIDINSCIIVNEDPFVSMYTPLSYALFHNTLESEKRYRKSPKEVIVKKLIEAGADVNSSMVWGFQGSGLRETSCLSLTIQEYKKGNLSKDFLKTMIDKVDSLPRTPIDSYFEISTLGDVDIIKVCFDKIKSYDDTTDTLMEFLLASIYFPCIVASNKDTPIPDYVADYCIEISEMPFVLMNVKQITERFFSFNNGNGLYEKISEKYSNDYNWQSIVITFELLKKISKLE